MNCLNCDSPHVENPEIGLCASCAAALRKAERQTVKDSAKREAALQRQKEKKKQASPIPKVSGKMSSLLTQYSHKKTKWIAGKRCAVYPDSPATTVHHIRGRVGFADLWARENNIPLLLDERFWIACSIKGHKFIEDNRDWAISKGFTIPRSTND